MRAKELTEIQRLSDIDFGGQDFVFGGLPYGSKKLPGGSGYTYLKEFDEISIFDGVKRIGRMYVPIVKWFPLQPARKVETIAVRKNYQGQGIAKALYGLALLPKPDGMGSVLIAGSSQTPGGRKNWVSLNSIPGVEVSGIIAIDPTLLSTKRYPFDTDKQYTKRKKAAEIFIDRLMSSGVLYLGDQDMYDGWHIFQFPVESNQSNTELVSMVNDAALQVYGRSLGIYWTSLMARYVG